MNLLEKTLLTAALVTGAPSPVGAQAPKSPTVSTATVSNNVPFDGSREQFAARTKNLDYRGLEDFRTTENEILLTQGMAADQAVAHMARIRDNKPVLDILKKSIADKRDGKAANPEADVKSYLDRKDAGMKQFFDQRLKSTDAGTVSPSQAQMRAATDMMKASADPKSWQTATQGWNKDSLRELQSDATVAVKDQRDFVEPAASLIAKVSNPKLLTIMLQDKDLDAVRKDINDYRVEQTASNDRWTREARNKPAPVSAASPVVPPVAVIPPSTIEPAPALSSQGCKAPFAGAAAPKSDPVKFAKDFSSQPSGTPPDLSAYNKFSDKPALRLLRETLLVDGNNQKNMAKQAIDGILLGHDPTKMLAEVRNPEVRELIEKSARPGMTAEQRTYLDTQVGNKIDGRFMEGNAAIGSAMATIDAQPRERTLTTAPKAPAC